MYCKYYEVCNDCTSTKYQGTSSSPYRSLVRAVSGNEIFSNCERMYSVKYRPLPWYVYLCTKVCVTCYHCTKYTSTVLMGETKAIFLKIHYFHVLTFTLERKFHAYSKNGLKKFHMISEGPKFFD